LIFVGAHVYSEAEVSGIGIEVEGEWFRGVAVVIEVLTVDGDGGIVSGVEGWSI